MKKLLVSVLAIAGLAACATDDVVRELDNRAPIAFDTFVENATRADNVSTTTGNITEFSVWAYMNEANGIVFNDELVSRSGDAWSYTNLQYWLAGNNYSFAAFAGDRDFVEGLPKGLAMGEEGLGTITFTNENGTNDILYAQNYVDNAAANQQPVSFQFDHLLSKVRFTFANGFANDNNKIVVKNIKMTSAEVAQLNLNTDSFAYVDDAAYTWTGHKDELTLEFGHMAAGAKVARGDKAISDEDRLVIPADADYEYTVTFDVEVYNGEQLGLKKHMEVKVSGVELVAGHSYNFVATINQENLNLNAIEFEVTVDTWEEFEYNGGAVEDEVTFVSTAAELTAALAKGGDIILAKDIEAGDNALFTVGKGVNANIDLAGHTLSSTSSATGKNYNLFDVNGAGATLTIKNGTITTEHKGTNMGWSNSTNVFNVTAGGVLNLENVTAKNLGGSDMGFVAHLNNWGEVTLNVENSTLESNYVAVRVFNSGYDMNNVSIYNSTLKGGSYAFWVHNYTVADFGSEAKAESQKALLNVDIFNGTNTFIGKNDTPIRYGMTNAEYRNVNNYLSVNSPETLAAALTADLENIEVVLIADIEVPISAIGTTASGDAKQMGGANTKNITIDLNGKKLNLTTTYWSVLGAKNSDAIVTIKNGTMTSSQATGTWNSYDLCFSNCNYNFENVVFEKAIALEAANKSYNLKNVTINETHDYYAMWITAEGQNVTIDGLTVNSLGRGIKIDEQYVGAPAKVTLNIANATFKTANKAAILVKSVAGAEINVEGINISNVAKDTEFAVWVDEDAAAYADLVVVNGALVKVEGAKDTVASSATELAEAVQNGAKNVYLENGTYTLASYPAGLKLVGCGDNVVFDATGKKYGVHGDVTIENVEVRFANADYTGFQHTNVEVYKNCTIVGQPFLYGADVTFEGCTFEQTSASAYNVWTYGAKAVKFVDCVFNCAGKSVLIYTESGDGQTVLFEGCTLNASAPVVGKAAIEIDSSLIKGAYNVVINDTTANGFANGSVSGNSLWNNKKGNKTTITVDGVTVL